MSEQDLGGDTLRGLRRFFSTNVPKSYMEYMVEEGAHSIGAEFKEEKDSYHFELRNSICLQSNISCKCRVSEEGKLELLKASFNYY